MDPIRVPTAAVDLLKERQTASQRATADHQTAVLAICAALGVPAGWALKQIAEGWAFVPPPEAGKEG